MKKAISTVTVLMLLLAMAVPASGLSRASYANYNNVHELGHLMGIRDHYGLGCPSTAQVNAAAEAEGHGGNLFNDNCIYGGYYLSIMGSSYSTDNYELCNGCRKVLLKEIPFPTIAD